MFQAHDLVNFNLAVTRAHLASCLGQPGDQFHVGWALNGLI
jgi:hypothetical protein